MLYKINPILTGKNRSEFLKEKRSWSENYIKEFEE